MEKNNAKEAVKMRQIASSFPYFSDKSMQNILREIEASLRSGRLTDGPHAQEFEAKFARYTGAKCAVAVNSGTAALEVALRCLGVKDKEVIVPTNTFISSPNSVIFAGGKPVLADMKADTLCLDIEDAKRKLTPKTAGVIVVHIAGLICPQIRELQQFCRDNDLFLIEDAAHAHGATLDGQKAGTFGDVGCFSFYPTKVMTSTEGGMIVTNNSGLAETARCMRSCGQNNAKKVVMLGHNWRLNEMAAIVGKHQLESLEEFLIKRNKVAAAYEETLSEFEEISLFNKPKNIRHSYYKYPVKLRDGISREKLSLMLKERFGVEAGHVYYPPCHLHPFYLEKFALKGKLPVAEFVLNQVLCLPMHVGLTEDDVWYIKDALISCINELSL
jgi:perosamine synthetase